MEKSLAKVLSFGLMEVYTMANGSMISKKELEHSIDLMVISSKVSLQMINATDMENSLMQILKLKKAIS